MTHEHSHEHAAEVATGGVALDIGPGRGALIIYPDERYRGLEIEITDTDGGHRVHTGVHDREAGSGVVLTAVFGSHPYASNVEGLRDNLRTLTVDQIKARAATVLSRTGLVIAAVGDIDEADFARELDKAFGALPAGPAQAELPEWKPSGRARMFCTQSPSIT